MGAPRECVDRNECDPVRADILNCRNGKNWRVACSDGPYFSGLSAISLVLASLLPRATLLVIPEHLCLVEG
jgi:hypothetical protein